MTVAHFPSCTDAPGSTNTCFYMLWGLIVFEAVSRLFLLTRVFTSFFANRPARASQGVQQTRTGRPTATPRTPPRLQGHSGTPNGATWDSKGRPGKPQGSSGACLCFVLVHRHACPCTLNGLTQTRFPFPRFDRFYKSCI